MNLKISGPKTIEEITLSFGSYGSAYEYLTRKKNESVVKIPKKIIIGETIYEFDVVEEKYIKAPDKKIHIYSFNPEDIQFVEFPLETYETDMPLTGEYFFTETSSTISIVLPRGGLSLGNLFYPPLTELSLTIVDSVGGAIDGIYSVFSTITYETSIRYRVQIPDPNNPGQFLNATTIQDFINTQEDEGLLTKIIINYQRPSMDAIEIKHNLGTLKPVVWMIRTFMNMSLNGSSIGTPSITVIDKNTIMAPASLFANNPNATEKLIIAN